jgi:hypothetical protein
MAQGRLGRFVAAALLLGASGAGLAVATPASASASSGGSRTIECKAFGGALESNDFKLLRCDGDTRRSSLTTSFDVLMHGGTITWTNGETTTISAHTSVAGRGTCRGNSYELKVRGTVTADTTGSTRVNHVVKANLCHSNTNGIVSLAPHTTFVL